MSMQEAAMDKEHWPFGGNRDEECAPPRGHHRRGRGGHGPFGGGFGMGGPPGGDGPPGGPGGGPWGPLGALLGNLFTRGRRARRGDVRAGILVLLAEQPRNGYQIMQELEQRSQGSWRPSSGSVYPALAQLEDEGLVKEEKTGSGRTFDLTAEGKRYVGKHKDELAAAWESATESNEGDGHERWEMMMQIRPMVNALVQIAHEGTSSQRAEAGRILAETRCDD